jgi:hypothetical protein
MLRSHRRTIQREKAAAFEDAIDNRVGQVFIMQHTSPLIQRFVGGEDHCPLLTMPIVDDVKEHVGCVRAAGEVSDLIDDQDRGMRVRGERRGKASGAKGRRQIIDQFRGRHKERIKAVLNRAVREGDRQMRFPPTGLAIQDQTVAFRREVGRQRGAEE